MQTVIINHYPPVIKQIKEMQQIARAEDIEFEKLKAVTTQTIRNMFVYTADETGVKRFETVFKNHAESIAKPRRSKGLYTFHDEPPENEFIRINGDAIELFRGHRVIK